jgi:hypothetical protein
MSRRDGHWDYTIRAYYPPNARWPAVPNQLAIETVHVGESSRDLEISVFRQRMRRGEIGHIEVISHVEPFGVRTIYASGEL